MVIERLRKKKEQQNEGIKEDEEIFEDSLLSTREILTNPYLSELLSLALERDSASEEDGEKKKELLAKLIKKEELTEEDFEDLDAYRQEIKNTENSVKEVLDLLTPERIRLISANSDSFRKLVGHIGVENTQKFLKSYLSRLVIVDKNGFKNLREKLTAITEAEEKLNNIDNQLSSFAKEYNIPSEALESALAADNPEDALEELIKNNLSTLGKIRNWLGERGWIGGRRFVEERLQNLDKIDDISNQLDIINQASQEIGNMIGNAVFKTKEGRSLLSAVLTGAKIEKTPGISIVEAAKGLLSPDELRREFESFLNEELKGRQTKEWSGLGEDERQNLWNRFFDQRVKGKKSSIVNVVRVIMEEALNGLGFQVKRSS